MILAEKSKPGYRHPTPACLMRCSRQARIKFRRTRSRTSTRLDVAIAGANPYTHRLEAVVKRPSIHPRGLKCFTITFSPCRSDCPARTTVPALWNPDPNTWAPRGNKRVAVCRGGGCGRKGNKSNANTNRFQQATGVDMPYFQGQRLQEHGSAPAWRPICRSDAYGSGVCLFLNRPPRVCIVNHSLWKATVPKRQIYDEASIVTFGSALL